ncbi:ABC transporter ATP-binding protein [Sphingomonas sp. ASV193]|uniref:ABC transporter ATP-binding protein n=1 Tax=Sphingomonas sp. ASV193 TaxID=3144405 RepID=UPI0032E8C08A
MKRLRLHDVAIPNRLSSVTLEVEAGRKLALIGPNGGGKTSLLRAIAGVDEATGRVSIDGIDLGEAGPRRAQLVGFMPASRDLAWPIPVRDMIALGNPRLAPGEVAEWIARVELDTLADRPVNLLSTGERARVLMARVLAGKPPLLLLDEPLSNLDPYWVLRFLEAIDQAAADGAIVLAALHDLSVADRFDRALLIDGGAVVADDSPAKLLSDQRFADAFRVERNGAGWKIRV